MESKKQKKWTKIRTWNKAVEKENTQVVARGEQGRGMSEIIEGDWKVQTSSYKTNESQEWNVQHGE